MIKKKQILCVLIISGVLTGMAPTVSAGTADSGKIRIQLIASTVMTTVSSLNSPTTPTPFNLSAGKEAPAALVVREIIIDNNSVNGWTLKVTSANGSDGQPTLLNSTDDITKIDYTLEIGNVSGNLGKGLLLNLSPATGETLSFIGKDAIISPTGIAGTATSKYRFNLLLNITDENPAVKRVGSYEDTLILTLASDD